MLDGMTLDLDAAQAPLRPDPGGVVRVGGTRVSLDAVVHAYLGGDSAEGIGERYPALDLADIHATIAFFLRNRTDVETYLAVAREHEEAVRAEVEQRCDPSGLRSRLVTRRHA